MGHKGDTYHDIQSNGIEFLRSLYAKADLRIRPETNNGNMALFKKMVKEMARELNVDPDQVLAREAFAEPHRIYATPEERDQLEIRVLTKAFVQGIKDQLKGS